MKASDKTKKFKNQLQVNNSESLLAEDKEYTPVGIVVFPPYFTSDVYEPIYDALHCFLTT